MRSVWAEGDGAEACTVEQKMKKKRSRSRSRLDTIRGGDLESIGVGCGSERWTGSTIKGEIGLKSNWKQYSVTCNSIHMTQNMELNTSAP